MPTYSYSCEKCKNEFELFAYIKDYIESPACTKCGSLNTFRQYAKDVLTQSSSIKKSDSELKTLGDLALRNSERMSEDQKRELYQKHNAYKEDTSQQKELPSGMSRLKKPSKPEWIGTKPKKRRAINNAKRNKKK
jgi:putative FmdB family regulatory protein